MGYKDTKVASVITVGNMFYLNHVGYKDRSELAGREFCFSFIWTMWDIKIFFEKWVWRSFWKFYLNHVGYKGNTLCENVKKISCFIWTMWDIKPILLEQWCEHLKEFYLNHVGYKEIWLWSKLVLFPLVLSEPCGI